MVHLLHETLVHQQLSLHLLHHSPLTATYEAIFRLCDVHTFKYNITACNEHITMLLDWYYAHNA